MASSCRILVAAGTNGAGKSSIVGEYFSDCGTNYFNPDAYAQQQRTLGTSPEVANQIAWKVGFNALQNAIAEKQTFAFETTLGGSSIIRELHRAIDAGLHVAVFYVGLDSPEMHIARVKARVIRGGHDIPTKKIRERYPRSLANLVSLIGKAAEIHVFDNSAESRSGAPAAGLVFRMRKSKITEPKVDALILEAPDWAIPLVAAAMRSHLGKKWTARASRAADSVAAGA